MYKDKQKRYSINFDLSIKALEKYYSSRNPKRAYIKIEDFFKKEGYMHAQGSGYHSVNEIISQDVIDTLEDLSRKYIWINKSIKSI